jgi:DHA2 family multidrug resistance protein
MTAWTPAVSEWTMVINTMLQGAGLGFVFIPLQVIAFATLDSSLRTEGTALLSLLRNIGSAIGISVTGALVTRNMQIEHSVLTGYVTPLNRAFQGAASALSPVTAQGAQMLDAMIGRQSEIIAYNNDWKVMMLMSLPMLLLLLLMRRPARPAPGAVVEHAAVMD